jgi:hypothetical protein
MSDYKKSGHDWCPPSTENPAPQPQPPSEGEDCPKYEEPKWPDEPEPEKCPDPDPCCKCPPNSGTDPTCKGLDDLIAKQAAEIAAAETSKVFKADLEALLTKARAASQEYTRSKYDELLEKWKKEDVDIVELIRKLVCAVPCWRCILDCYVCPLLNQLHYAEKKLYDDGKLIAQSEIHDLYDLRYWHTRNTEAKERVYLRIQNVLKAWEKPAATIEAILAANKTAIEAAGKVIGVEPGKAIYDVFLKIIPLHLAIAPPADVAKTNIDKKYTEFCPCDTGDPQTCCGPDVGPPTLRQRLIGPQPYLIDPADYFKKIICCLIEKWYGPAKDALTKAKAKLAAVEADIARYKAQLDDGLKNFEKTAKGAIPAVIDCCDYKKHDDDCGHDHDHDYKPKKY